MTKIIVVTSCDDCPFNGACPAWKKLTSEQRISLTLGVGIGDFVLRECHLEDG